jgi:microcystin-dependent protein
MPIKISSTKGWVGAPAFDTFVPLLTENANIQDALELFYYGNSQDGIGYDTVNSIYANLLSLQNGTASAQFLISGHVGATAAHGATGAIVGTTNTQTLTNKTISNPTFTISSAIAGPNLAPVGSIVMYGASTPPAGWIVCNGQSTAAYPALAAVVGANVPDLRGRVPMGHGDSPDAQVISDYATIGAKFGNETVALAIANMPSHNHPYDASDGLGSTNRTHFMDRNAGHGHGVSDPGHAHTTAFTGELTNSLPGTTQTLYRQSLGANDPNYLFPGTNNVGTGISITGTDTNHRHTIEAQGSGTAHENRQPSTVVQFIIKY